MEATPGLPYDCEETAFLNDSLRLRRSAFAGIYCGEDG